MITSIDGVKIHSLACAVPHQQYTLYEYAPHLFSAQTAKRAAKRIGFEKLRITDEHTTTADLVMTAAEKIFADYDKNKIGALLFVSQTPDYVLPATSHILQDKLGLSREVYCLDVNEGCSGFVSGLYLAMNLAKSLKKAVCFTGGDTASKLTAENDSATRGIFGDAGFAVIIEPGEDTYRFSFASYGESYRNIIIENSAVRKSSGSVNSGHIFMNGTAIMDFALNEVSKMIEAFLAESKLAVSDISLYACHQANKVILNTLADTLNVSRDIMPFIAGDTGNESSASVPMVLNACQNADLSRVLCCGFGVGLSIGLCMGDFSKVKYSGVTEL